VQASPDGAYPRSGLTVPDLAMGEIIGRGSSSVVRQAEVAPSPSTGGRSMTVAVKIMETVHNPELRKQLLSELHLLLPRLREKHCPYIARIFEVMYEKLDDRLYIVLEYCHGGSLDAVLRNAGPVAARPAAQPERRAP
jgi:serine/threonine protein kinase